MDARAIIAAIRDGQRPGPEALRWFAAGLADGTVTDAQAGAFAMAVLLKGLGEEGRVALTTGMRDSGKVLAWDMPGPVLDKHSTGGIGDKTSFILAPIASACGVLVPMTLTPHAMGWVTITSFSVRILLIHKFYG
jgi:thymidine phosphorylase